MRLLTPSIVIRGVPAPVIFAPIALRKFARSTTSGSHAAHSMTVVPLASAAADMTLAVPSTVEPKLPPRKISAPVSLSARAMMSPPSRSITAPSASSPRR